MKDLKHWQDKIKEKRKQTSWRDFAMEIASWFYSLWWIRYEFRILWNVPETIQRLS